MRTLQWPRASYLIACALLVALLVTGAIPVRASGGVVTDCSSDAQFSSLLTTGGTITFNCGAAASIAASTFVALRTRSASASARSTASSAAERPMRASTVHASSARSSSMAERGRSSATTIFIASEYNPCVSNGRVRPDSLRPAVVQIAKSFQMVGNNAVTRDFFHRLFHRICVNRRRMSWGADLKR